MTVVANITGIPAPIDGNHVLIVTVTYDAAGFSGSDWGSSYTGDLYMIQNSVKTTGETIPFSNTRQAYTKQYEFAPIAGYTIECGIEATAGGTVGVSFFNVKVQAELVKR